MAIKYRGDGIYTCLVADTKPTIGITTGSTLLETDTLRPFYFDGTGWKSPESFINARTWTIYKQGTNYKAKNEYLGYSPTTGISPDLHTTWAYIASNFDTAGDPTDTDAGGSVEFAKGLYTFTQAPAIMDNTWSAASQPIHIRGQGMYATKIRVLPASAIDTAFEIKSLSHGSIKDLWLDINNNVTNAVKLNADTADAANNVLRDLYITNINNSSAPLSGQRGIYLVNDSDNFSLFFNLFDTIYMRFMHHGIDTTGCVGLNNTSYLIRNIKMWEAEYGITLKGGAAGRSLQSQITNIWHQCSATNGLYTVKIEDANIADTTTRSRYHIIDGVIADNNLKAGNWVVIVGKGASHCRVDNVNASGNTDRLLLDRSGNATNQFSNCDNYPTSRQRGSVNFTSHILSNPAMTTVTAPPGGSTVNIPQITGHGLFAAGLIHEVVGTGSIINTNLSVANGKVLSLTTGTGAVPNQSALRSPIWVAAREFAPKLVVRFHCSAIAAQRWFIGLTEHDAIAPSDDAYITAQAVVAICQRSTDTQFQLLYNDTIGAPNFIPMKDSSNANINVDTTVHVFWVFMDAIENKLYASLDGNTPIEITSDFPDAGNMPLKFFASMEGTTTTSKTLNLYKVDLETRQ
jgi:hypothetical protein